MTRLVVTALAFTLSISLSIAVSGCSDPREPSSEARSDTGAATLDRSRAQALDRAEAALAEAESIRAIKRLQHAYAQTLSAGRWDDAAALFAADAVATFGDTELTGRAAIREHLSAGRAEGLADGELDEHLILSPVVNAAASGDRAQGRWRLVALHGRIGESASWEGGIFENDYVNDAGTWRIARLHYYPLYGGPYATGWRNLSEETQDEVAPVPFHYDADRAGIPSPAAHAGILSPPADAATSVDDAPLSNGSASDDGASARGADQRDAAARAELEARLTSLGSRASRLLDEQAVLNLQNAYGYYVDRMLWDDVADLFADNGTLELDARGVYRGRDSIRRALDQFGPDPLPPDRINDHLQLQTLVNLGADGTSARARGTELRMTGTYQGDAAWGIATFDNTFVRVDGAWRIESMHVYTRMLTGYDAGWADQARPVPVAAAGFAPDAPPTVEYAAYPAFFSPAFDFDGISTIGPDPTEPRDGGAQDDGAQDDDTRRRDAAEPRETTQAAFADRLTELERQLRVLDAYDGAENVSNAYGYYIDEFLWDGMADLFATGGWKELSYIGTYVGRERVRDSVVSRYGRGGRRANSRTLHQKTQPVITVADDGRSARIRTRLFQLNSSTSAAGSYISGIYENEIVNEDGIWRIQGMDLDYAWTASYDPGWARVEAGSATRFAPAPGSLTGDAAPDAPLRGVVYAPYPEGQVDMAFHYANPVSGRAPPLLLEVREY